MEEHYQSLRELQEQKMKEIKKLMKYKKKFALVTKMSLRDYLNYLN